MPVYEFECLKCGHVTEMILPLALADVRVTSCERCPSKARKIVSRLQNVKPDWEPYLDENLGDEPVMVEGRGHRRKILKEKGLEEHPISDQRRREIKDKHAELRQEFKKSGGMEHVRERQRRRAGADSRV